MIKEIEGLFNGSLFDVLATAVAAHIEYHMIMILTPPTYCSSFLHKNGSLCRRTRLKSPADDDYFMSSRVVRRTDVNVNKNPDRIQASFSLKNLKRKRKFNEDLYLEKGNKIRYAYT